MRVRTTGPHMVRTEVETLNEALNVLERRHAFEKPKPKRPRTLKQVFGSAHLGSHNRMNPKPKKTPPLPPTGFWPRPYHIQCGRCGRPKAEALKGECGLLNRCLWRLLT